VHQTGDTSRYSGRAVNSTVRKKAGITQEKAGEAESTCQGGASALTKNAKSVAGTKDKKQQKVRLLRSIHLLLTLMKSTTQRSALVGVTKRRTVQG